MSPAPVVVVGDVLLDRDLDGHIERLAPDAPVPVVDQSSERVRPGGAGLSAALAAADGREVVLITALARDQAAAELRAALDRAGVTVVDLGMRARTPEKVRVRASGRSMLRIDRGGRDPADVGAPGADACEALRSAPAVLVSDYGRGVTAQPGLRATLEAAARRRPVLWDPHPRGAIPIPGCRVATPNAAEAAGFAPEVPGEGIAGSERRARTLARAWSSRQVCVTLGADGAVLAGESGAPLVVPAPEASGGDPCGAGDRFASAFAGLLADGAEPAEAMVPAVACASRFVASGGAGAVRLDSARRRIEPHGADVDDADADAVVARVRARGGTVVATGGCFDILHAGHLSLLRAARALGDCLVVCINSDESVRRLKGPGRPLVPERERAALLGALDCVDAVAVFREDTPHEILARLRPEVWAKGGDYTVPDLPEADVVEAGGGRAVILPYVEGRSTTRLIEEAMTRGAA
ncbi:MAG: D-glycero-beta-D-manno-heptose 1-phosphate adenylyltransferase [Thermoleophilaceae bacterium]